MRIQDRLPDTRNFRTSVKGPGVVFWEGNSLFDDSPIAVICNGFKSTSNNRKTGPMIHVYILRRDIDPWKAIVSGEDRSICGNCIHRPQLGAGQGRSCYVQVYPWVTTVYQTYKRGSYTPIENVFGRDPFKNRYVRVGTYGDPAAVPTYVWVNMLASVAGYTMYTHFWKDCDQALRNYAMASVDGPKEQALAKEMGWRTFRTRFAHEPLQLKEMICPASEEAKKKKQCIECRLCDGTDYPDNRKDISIVVHGSGINWYTAARSDLNARKQALLPIIEQ